MMERMIHECAKRANQKITSLFYVYAFEGVILFISNGIVAFAIARYPVLRQRYMVQLAQIAVDSIMGIALIVAGIGRLIIVYTDQTELRSRRTCMLMPWNILSIWAEPMTAVCLLMVSIDRLVALTSPIVYFRRNSFIQNFQVAAWNVFMWSIVVVSWCFSFQDTEKTLSPFCWTSDSTIPTFNFILLVISISTSSASVILYVFVFLISRQHVNRVRKFQKDQHSISAFEERQRRLTVTMGVSCIFTMILYVLPICLKIALNDIVDQFFGQILNTYAAISTSLNPISNIIVILLRQDDINERLMQLLPIYCRKILEYLRKEKFQRVEAHISTNKSSK